MAIDLCFYFQVHQPWRLRHYRYLEVGKNQNYFDEEKNATIMRKVAHKCYLPMNNLIYDLITEYRGAFRVAFSISGTAMEQMEAYVPEVLTSFQRIFETGCAELLSETSHHSLASLYSRDEFNQQVMAHQDIATRHLCKPSKVFRNTELIMSNEIAQAISALGYKGVLIEGADHILRWRSPLFKYRMQAAPELTALVKNYRLSDDIAFRFSDRKWGQWPLTSEKFADWVKMIEVENPVAARGGVPFLGLFMDYETFGEHQWAHTGIFDFMRALPGKLLKTQKFRFVTPTQAIEESSQGGSQDRSQEEDHRFLIDTPKPFSWADVERDLSAWRGNPIQDSALLAIYRIESAVRDRAKEWGGERGAELVETWRRLQTSDHFYYMCTKYFEDGDVHKYFNPYETPYDAHIIYMNVLADFAERCGLGSQKIA